MRNRYPQELHRRGTSGNRACTPGSASRVDTIRPSTDSLMVMVDIESRGNGIEPPVTVAEGH